MYQKLQTKTTTTESSEFSTGTGFYGQMRQKIGQGWLDAKNEKWLYRKEPNLNG